MIDQRHDTLPILISGLGERIWWESSSGYIGSALVNSRTACIAPFTHARSFHANNAPHRHINEPSFAFCEKDGISK